MSALSNKRFRVTVLEWLAYKAVVEAPDAATAEVEARALWDQQADHQKFSFDDSGIDGIQVEEIPQ